MQSGAVGRLSGILLIGSFILNMGGVLLFSGHNTYGWFDETPTSLRWERRLFIAAYVVATLGVALLELSLREASAGAAVLARLGATAFLMAVGALVAEAATFIRSCISSRCS